MFGRAKSGVLELVSNHYSEKEDFFNGYKPSNAVTHILLKKMFHVKVINEINLAVDNILDWSEEKVTN